MKKLTGFLLAVFALSFTPANAENIYDEMTNKICKCIEENKADSSAAIQPCMVEQFAKNIKPVMEIQGAETFNDVNHRLTAEVIAGKLMADCPAFIAMIPDSVAGMNELEADSNVNCAGIQTGEFYQLKQNRSGSSSDTMYMTITDSLYIERSHGGRHYEISKIIWKDDCNFSLQFIESNSALHNARQQAGHIDDYSIINNEVDFMVLETEVHGRKFRMKIYKISDSSGK